MGWKLIDRAPKDGTPVDLWIVGDGDSVQFLTDFSKVDPDRKKLQGRTCGWRWIDGDWRLKAGLTPLMGLRAHGVVATHWMPLPSPPRGSE